MKNPPMTFIPWITCLKHYGIGRVGQLKAPVLLEDFIDEIKSVFQLEGLRLIEPKAKRQNVQRIAICGGSGEQFYQEAVKAKADVYITGDISLSHRS